MLLALPVRATVFIVDVTGWEGGIGGTCPPKDIGRDKSTMF